MDRNPHTLGRKMSAVETARDWARILENHEKNRTGVPMNVARSTVARRIGVPPSKMTSLRKNRLKDIGVAVYEALGRAIINQLEAELRHAEHEVQVCRQIGADPSDGEMQSALGRAAKVRDALGLEP